MLAKCVGALCILSASLWWSNLQIAKLKARVRQLEAFRLGLRLLAAEVGYTATPLPRALKQVAKQLGVESVSAFFQAVCRNLQEEKFSDATGAWLAAIEAKRENLQLTANDWMILSRAAAGLGGLGRDDQLKQLAAAETQLAAQAAEAAAAFAGSEKMWRYLGILSGLAVVILLL
ncbi:MAG: hypothetical protein GX197_06925 [Firmicutes bacterium]|nr:hypothetical protein [Bacillota bacterium]